MSEEEIINILSDEIVSLNVGHEKYEQAVKGLIDLYNKEKEKNKELENDYVAKDKIRLKMKQEMDKGYRLSEERHLQNYAYDRLKELLEE